MKNEKVNKEDIRVSAFLPTPICILFNLFADHQKLNHDNHLRERFFYSNLALILSVLSYRINNERERAENFVIGKKKSFTIIKKRSTVTVPLA
jgi:hypothetical protein